MSVHFAVGIEGSLDFNMGNDIYTLCMRLTSKLHQKAFLVCIYVQNFLSYLSMLTVLFNFQKCWYTHYKNVDIHIQHHFSSLQNILLQILNFSFRNCYIFTIFFNCHMAYMWYTLCMSMLGKVWNLEISFLGNFATTGKFVVIRE